MQSFPGARGITPPRDAWRCTAGGQHGQGSATVNCSKCPHPDCDRIVKDLASHLVTHKEVRPEKCPIASCRYHTKGFARKYVKNRHALTHYRGTMVCPFCPGPGNPCEKEFMRADVFERHLANSHNVELMPPNSRGFGRLANLLPEAANKEQNHEGCGLEETSQEAQCSICRVPFAAAQEFYEHLDECVLSVIMPPVTAATATVSLWQS
ncbi:hypothetical protein RJ55_07883 [Drechmeria coniospora]|nr:hypothetical protein RJ55_07883 [Drechmeria coniospora]